MNVLFVHNKTISLTDVHSQKWINWEFADFEYDHFWIMFLWVDNTLLILQLNKLQVNKLFKTPQTTGGLGTKLQTKTQTLNNAALNSDSSNMLNTHYSNISLKTSCVTVKLTGSTVLHNEYFYLLIFVTNTSNSSCVSVGFSPCTWWRWAAPAAAVQPAQPEPPPSLVPAEECLPPTSRTRSPENTHLHFNTFQSDRNDQGRSATTKTMLYTEQVYTDDLRQTDRQRQKGTFLI